MAENNLMLALWREAGRHVDATDSIPLLAGLLGVSLPVSGLRLDERRNAEQTTLSRVVMR